LHIGGTGRIGLLFEEGVLLRVNSLILGIFVVFKTDPEDFRAFLPLFEGFFPFLPLF